ncbi:hypothetical protein L1S34_06780 [Flavobacterium sp. K77]|uniref:hypothetical protein n=1 Tax=Flavobacterium sp. K77 TaxID=2910676 RepID=UPI001F47390F|nr:hypothetical protein [Flavobacterium sp. K77]MCF6140984.1 hypothetical protein [Flavobacterium sp. K77]
MEKNPFSLFDFLGYFIPGAFGLFLFYFLQNINGLEYYFYYENIKTLNTDISIVHITFFVILSYTLGHILSFLSTLTIENFTVWMFGYPSKNLLLINGSGTYFEKKRKNENIDKKATFVSYSLRFLLFVFLSPISISSITIGKLLDLNNSVYKKSLGEPYINLIKTEIEVVFKRLNNNLQIDFINHDYNKLLIHYSYNVNAPHQPKLMNYVSLYGFLRVISLVFNLLSVFMFLKIFLFNENLNINLSEEFNNESIIFFISAFLTYISYLGYLKFYRRYTQENLMILLLK